MIKDHWWRADTHDGLCLRTGCARPREHHIQGIGEWMEPTHWFLPWLLHPAYCMRCGYHRAHSTHRHSREHRRLRKA